jgi:hypothetical protein
VSLNKRTRGKTQFSTPFFFADTSSATGDGLSGVTSASPGLMMEYRRQGQSTWTSVTPQSGKTLGIYLSRGIVADGSLAGAYEVDFPDAAYASESGVEWVALRVRGVTNMLATTLMIELDAADYSDPVRLGLTSLPNVAQGSAGALPTGNASGQVTVATLTAGAIQSFWDFLTSGLTTAGSIGKWIFDNLNATVSSRATLAEIEGSTILAKDATVAKEATASSILTAIQNLNNLSAKMNIFGSPLLEIPDAGSTVYAFTVVVKDDEDKLVSLDASPTITAANAAGTNRSGNLSAVSNPSTGRYTFTYSVPSTHAAESLRITVSGAVSTEARYIEWIGAVVDYDTLTILNAIKLKTDNLPANPAAVSDIPTANQNRDAVWNALTTVTYTDGSMGDRILVSNNNTREVSVTGSGHIASVLHDAEPNSIPEDAFQAGALSARVLADGAIDAGSIVDGAFNGKGNWLTTLGANAPSGWINEGAIANNAITGDKIAASAVTKVTVGLFKYNDVQRWNSPANQIDVTISKV